MSHQTNRRQITLPCHLFHHQLLFFRRRLLPNSIVTSDTYDGSIRQDRATRADETGRSRKQGSVLHTSLCYSPRQLRLIRRVHAYRVLRLWGAKSPVGISELCCLCLLDLCWRSMSEWSCPIFPSMAPLIQNHTAVSIDPSLSSGPLQWTRGKKTSFGR